MTYLWWLLKGLVIGIANIIPGVSGGTMALILGLYERILNALGNINGSTIVICLKVLSFKKEARDNFIAEMQRIDLPFLGTLAVGAGIGIVSLAKVMTILLTNFHDPTYGFFFGLVLLSAVVPYRLMRTKTVTCWIAMVIALVSVVGIDVSMSAEEKLHNAKAKIEIKLLKDELKAAKAKGETARAAALQTRINAKSSLKSNRAVGLVLLFGAGAISISAMILPGVSGSFLLLLFGLYFEILAAISRFDVLTLGVFAAGCGLGLLAFTRLLNWLIKRFHDTTMGFLLGLMLGSLWAIWPFKSSAIVGQGTAHQKTVFLANMLPAGFGGNEIAVILTFIAGCAIVAFFLKLEGKKPANESLNSQSEPQT